MPELDAEHRNQMAEAASGHRFVLDRHAYGEEACYCGWKRDGWDAPMHEDHLLDALAPLVAGWIADAWDAGYWSDLDTPNPYRGGDS